MRKGGWPPGDPNPMSDSYSKVTMGPITLHHPLAVRSIAETLRMQPWGNREHLMARLATCCHGLIGAGTATMMNRAGSAYTLVSSEFADELIMQLAVRDVLEVPAPGRGWRMKVDAWEAAMLLAMGD